MTEFATLNGLCALLNSSMLMHSGATLKEDSFLTQTQTLDRFLAGVEKRAFQIARLALRDADDALDVVQDAMLKLARNYAQQPSDEWRPLFYRILNNTIRDYQRRRKVRNAVMSWLPGFKDEEEEVDPMQSVPDEGHQPPQRLQLDHAMVALQSALAELPARQQQAFMLRNFEGMDVAETALTMSCSEGSVKTHYSRAVHTLREKLGETW